MSHKDLRLGQIVYILVFYNIHFLGFFHWTVSNLIYKLETLQQLEDANTEWLKNLDGEIPKRKKKTEKDPEKVLEEPAPVQPQKKRRSVFLILLPSSVKRKLHQACGPSLILPSLLTNVSFLSNWHIFLLYLAILYPDGKQLTRKVFKTVHKYFFQPSFNTSVLVCC